LRHLISTGVDTARKVRGAISVILGSQVSLLEWRLSTLHNTAATKQWTVKWLCIANVIFSELCKTVVNKVT